MWVSIKPRNLLTNHYNHDTVVYSGVIYTKRGQMQHQIRVSDDTMNRLKACAEPFVDKDPEDVVRRLLDEHDSFSRKRAPSSHPLLQSARTPISRVPRERGTAVQIEGHQIQAVSVRDLYEQALKLLVGSHRADLDRILPFKTSHERYLLADKPIHPSGNPFVVPVEYHGYHMEAHKDYKNAVAHLGSLVEKLGMKLKYLR